MLYGRLKGCLVCCGRLISICNRQSNVDSRQTLLLALGSEWVKGPAASLINLRSLKFEARSLSSTFGSETRQCHPSVSMRCINSCRRKLKEEGLCRFTSNSSYIILIFSMHCYSKIFIKYFFYVCVFPSSCFPSICWNLVARVPLTMRTVHSPFVLCYMYILKYIYICIYIVWALIILHGCVCVKSVC